MQTVSGPVTIGNDGASTTKNTLAINGSVAYGVLNITGSNNLIALEGNHYSAFITGTGSLNFIALPNATTYSGRVYLIVNHSANSVNISDYTTANGITSASVLAGETVQLMSNGTDWHKIN